MNLLKQRVREFLEILETVDESESGREFHPVYISSCRVLLTQRLNEILKDMRTLSRETEDLKA